MKYDGVLYTFRVSVLLKPRVWQKKVATGKHHIVLALVISKSFLVKIQQSSSQTTFVFRAEDCLVENFYHLHPKGYVDTNMVGHVSGSKMEMKHDSKKGNPFI